MKNIIVIGAGLGGLYAAKELAAHNYKVTVYESKKKENLGYPWYDSVREKTFKNLNINLPENALVQKQVLTMISPLGNGGIKQPDRAKNDFDVDRKVLLETLLSDVEKTCTIHYNQKVEQLVYKDNFVIGIKTKKEMIACDLVIDSSGANSPFRQSTPDTFLMNDTIKNTDMFYVRRCYYESNDTSKKQSSNVYIFPIGHGIAWCKEAVNSNNIDILTGDFGKLPQFAHEDILRFLQQNNPLLSDKLVFDKKAIIPVSYPHGIINGNGYVLVGDSAFMTRPICGSGIEATLMSAKKLVSIILKASSYSQEALWGYSVWYMLKYGALFTTQYVTRVLAKRMSTEDLDWAFTSGLLSEGNVALLTLDKPNIKKFEIKNVGKSIEETLEKDALIKDAKDIFLKASKASALAITIPIIYDYEEIKKWKSKFHSYIENI